MTLQFKETIVKVTSLYQWHTYTGLIEGVPTDNMNKKILETIHKRATSLTDIKNYYLIEPPQTPIDIGRAYPFGKPMRLPSITCAVGLKYHGTSNAAIGGTSHLTLICFQETFALPFEPTILKEISTLDWFSHAEDLGWEDY